MRIEHDGFVVIADGRKVLLLRNEGDQEHLNLKVIGLDQQDNPPDRHQKTDAPGRAFSGVGHGRSAYDEADFHQIAEKRFAAEAADMLREHALGGDFESLVVVAPPTTLGELRKHYHKEVESRLSAEVAKNLTGHPISEIEKILLSA